MRARHTVVVLLALLAVYLILVGYRGVLLLGTGEPIAVALGAGVLALPALAAVLVAREIRFGAASQRLAAELAAERGLPADDLPRRPSGRAVRAAADARFAQRRAEVEGAPADWRGWFRLALAYDDAGDRRRAREALRHAIALHDRAARPH